MDAKEKTQWLKLGFATLVATALSLFGYALNHDALSMGLFLLVPFLTGVALGFVSEGGEAALLSGLTCVVISFVVLLLGGVEGVACVVMAFPLVFGSMAAGALGTSCLLRLFRKKPPNKTANLVALACCVALMSLAGWTSGGLEPPRRLTVETSVDFHAPMEDVWAAVRESSRVEGDSTALRLLGLPVPRSCVLADDGLTRTCHFDAGDIVQRVTREEYGRAYEVRIVEAFEVRPWISFDRAAYTFAQRDGHVRVTRTDHIDSTLRPRWYWAWFEEQCVRLEHRYVMGSMKRRAERADGQHEE